MQRMKRLLLVLTILVLFLAGATVFRCYNRKTVIYSGQWTYTTSDDHTAYLVRFPWVYMEPFLPVPSLGFANLTAPRGTSESMEQIMSDAMRYVNKYMERYNGHFNMDYALTVEGSQIVVTYIGYGRLLDGTIETIDAQEHYPAFRFEDQTAGTWKAPPYPWDPWTEEELETTARFQDPSEVIDPPFLPGSSGAHDAGIS